MSGADMVDWERAVREDGPAVWRTACRLLGNRQDAQECVQDAFVEAIALSRRQPVKSARALLLHVVTARAMDRLRRKYRRHSVDSPGDFEAVADEFPQPHQQAENAELLEKLRAALPTLPIQQSQAFVLHCVEGWSYQEIAERLGVSVGAVGMLILRARGKLKELLNADCGLLIKRRSVNQQSETSNQQSS
jgi:RNA polymerase sigma-70 factor (ECF subfamily)